LGKGREGGLSGAREVHRTQRRDADGLAAAAATTTTAVASARAACELDLATEHGSTDQHDTAVKELIDATERSRSNLIPTQRAH
jgi:hypothetical protein